MRTVLTNSSGIKIGEMIDKGDRIVLYDKCGLDLGMYHKSSNRTWNIRTNQCVGMGNVLGMLVQG